MIMIMMAMFVNYFIRLLCKVNGELKLWFKTDVAREFFRGDTTPKLEFYAARSIFNISTEA